MRNVLGIALASLLAIGVAASSGAASVEYSGTLSFGIGALPWASGGGTGVYVGQFSIVQRIIEPAATMPRTVPEIFECPTRRR